VGEDAVEIVGVPGVDPVAGKLLGFGGGRHVCGGG
jgi:cytochrome P450